MYMYTNVYNNAQAIAHQPPNNAPPAPWAVEKSEMDSCLLEISSAWCHMVWIAMEWLFQVGCPNSVLSQLFGPFAANGLGSVQHCLAATIDAGVLSTVFLLEPIT